MDLYKAQLFEFKGTRMGYYMEMSDGNDMGLMSDMIRYSDPTQSMQLMQGMMDYDPANAALMMGEVTQDGFDVFSHMSNAGDVNGNMIYRGGDANFDDVRAALVSGMMQDTSGESIDTMARIMADSDPLMSSYLVNEITNYGDNNPDNNLSMNVLASFILAPNVFLSTQTPFDFFTKRTEELRRKNVFSASSSIVVGFVVLDFLLKRLHENDYDDARNNNNNNDNIFFFFNIIIIIT
jgi:hypothetical protein